MSTTEGSVSIVTIIRCMRMGSAFTTRNSAPCAESGSGGPKDGIAWAELSSVLSANIKQERCYMIFANHSKNNDVNFKADLVRDDDCQVSDLFGLPVMLKIDMRDSGLIFYLSKEEAEALYHQMHVIMMELSFREIERAI